MTTTQNLMPNFKVTKKHIITFIIFAFHVPLIAYSFDYRGYVKYMPFYSEVNDENYFDNILHARINTKHTFNKSIKSALEIRIRAFYGDLTEDSFDSMKNMDNDNGAFDLTQMWTGSPDLIVISNIDRAWFQFENGNFEYRLGRQRINWGINYVWNPNDLFNYYSYFEFDYEERPGSDALKLSYYPSYTSTFELAHKPGKNNQPEVNAIRAKFNVYETDIQIIGGTFDNINIIGGGFASQLFDGGLRAETSYYFDSSIRNNLILSLSYDYTFDNSLFIVLEWLYNKNKNNENTQFQVDDFFSFSDFMVSKNTFFFEASFEINPLLRLTFALMHNDDQNITFINPAVYYSISQNIEGMLLAQIYPNDKSKDYYDTLFFRLKWSF